MVGIKRARLAIRVRAKQELVGGGGLDRCTGYRSACNADRRQRNFLKLLLFPGVIRVGVDTGRRG